VLETLETLETLVGVASGRRVTFKRSVWVYQGAQTTEDQSESGDVKEVHSCRTAPNKAALSKSWLEGWLYRAGFFCSRRRAGG